jgi:hypothetical protein
VRRGRRGAEADELVETDRVETLVAGEEVGETWPERAPVPWRAGPHGPGRPEGTSPFSRPAKATRTRSRRSEEELAGGGVPAQRSELEEGLLHLPLEGGLDHPGELGGDEAPRGPDGTHRAAARAHRAVETDHHLRRPDESGPQRREAHHVQSLRCREEDLPSRHRLEEDPLHGDRRRRWRCTTLPTSL